MIILVAQNIEAQKLHKDHEHKKVKDIGFIEKQIRFNET